MNQWFIDRRESLRVLAARFLHDSRGATTALVAVSMIALLGFAGAATETGVWYVTKRNLQGAADASAFGAALASGGSNTVLTTEAKAISTRYGYVDGTSGVTVTVNKPPTSGRFAGSTHAVEVIIQQPQTRTFSALFSSASLTLAGRAVSTIQFGAPACVLALNDGAAVDTQVVGTVDINLNGCSLAVNSNSRTALDIVGNAVINAASAQIVGGVSGNGTLNTTLGTETGAPPTKDPYAGTPIPNTQSLPCTPTTPPPNIDASGGTVKFCSDVTLGSHDTATLRNGVFVLDQASLKVNSGATLNVENATIILTSSTGDNYGSVNINSNNTVVNMTAPTTGPYAGLAMMQDPRAPTNVDDTFAGGATQNILGALYFPSQRVKFAGGTGTGTRCTQIVADEVVFNGNARVNSDCEGTGVKKITSPPVLVE